MEKNVQEYLKQFTEKALIATRAGDLEREKITAELETLLAEKPADASPDMTNYLQFLVTVVKGEEAEELWGKLHGDLQNIFGDVMKQMKGSDISEVLKELTKKAVHARQSGENTEAVVAELEMILQNAPKDGNDSVSHYITYLLALVQGNETEELASGIEQGLADIFHAVMQEVSGMDMMKFFDRLTESVFKEVKTGQPDQEISAEKVIEEMLQGSSPPPQAIVNYLQLLLAVLEKKDTIDEMLSDIAPEFQAIFNQHQNIKLEN